MAAFFEHAPVTLGVSLTTLFFSYAYGASDSLRMDGGSILRGGELWRFIFGHLAFANMSQTVVGLILIYTYRSFERQMGSRKYGAFLFLSWAFSTIVYLALMGIFAATGVSFSPSSGPFFFIFAQLAFFYRYVPKIYSNQYVLAGLTFSEKSGIYLLAVQLFFSDGLNSIAAAVIALLFGYLYSQNNLGLQRFRLPKFIETTFGTISTALSTLVPRTPAGPAANRHQLRQGVDPASRRGRDPVSATERTWLQQEQDAAVRLQQGGGLFGNHEQGFQMPPPDEESITTLMNLGFDRDAVIQALRSSANNVDAAANILLR